MVVKIVHDALVEMRADRVRIDLNAPCRRSPILMVGLQGSGKTTTTAKIARAQADEKDRKKVLMASLDTRRPAAQEQLRILGEQTSVPTLPIVAGQQPVEIAPRAMEPAARGLRRRAARHRRPPAIDEELMAEAAAVRDATQPARDAAGRRRDDRPGRGQRRQAPSTRRSASPASC
jgi:signal recognition particle subunit SRP54